jgi:uncharacterized protein (TIGR00266 family)
MAAAAAANTKKANSHSKRASIRRGTGQYVKHHSIVTDGKLPAQFETDDAGDNKFIPSFYIINSPSAASVIMNLAQDQAIYDNKGALNYCDSTVKVETKTGGILQGIARALVTTESMFMTYYTGTQSDRKTVISFASPLPGDIIGVRKPGEMFTMSSYNFVAATVNIKLNVKTRFRNIFGGGPIFINEAVNSSNMDGMVWLAAYGGIEHLHIPSGTSLKVDHGLFVVARSEFNYNITTIGGLKSFVFSGEGFAMHFHGPCDIYIQSRNINHFLHFLNSNMKMKQDGAKLSISF